MDLLLISLHSSHTRGKYPQLYSLRSPNYTLQYRFYLWQSGIKLYTLLCVANVVQFILQERKMKKIFIYQLSFEMLTLTFSSSILCFISECRSYTSFVNHLFSVTFIKLFHFGSPPISFFSSLISLSPLILPFTFFIVPYWPTQ